MSAAITGYVRTQEKRQMHIWLIQPNVNFEEVVRWYSEVWKALMNKALELGPDAPTRLPKPDFLAEAASNAPSQNGTSRTQPRPSARTQGITFHSIVEEFAASHNLSFLPTGRAHEKPRMHFAVTERRLD
ncbi:hypothetical protein EV421DRAFT_2045212 [Armillaria borealis]|uniref:Uncharacterized protein n=1 Tax=Armillaria borealis TaxID=47425 RepID=A0AA39M5N0_9AGAR|nr:hypothetical protein EV421DRAFT_2045212 [Armillaria borealis]